MKRASEPVAKWTRWFWASLLLVWLFVAIGSLVKGQHLGLALSLLGIVGALVNLWSDWRRRRSADLKPPLPER
jgi:hypothetical protein